MCFPTQRILFGLSWLDVSLLKKMQVIKWERCYMLEGQEKHHTQQNRSQCVLVGSILFSLQLQLYDGVMASIESYSLKKGIKMNLSRAEWLCLVLTSQKVIFCLCPRASAAATGR